MVLKMEHEEGMEGENNEGLKVTALLLRTNGKVVLIINTK
jgi:hypothetical protein